MKYLFLYLLFFISSTIAFGQRIDTSFVNVIDFGAKPNDGGQDTAAFRKAIATGRNVLVPHGVFHLDGADGTPILRITTPGQKIYGHGARSIIKTNSNTTVIYAGMTDSVTVEYLNFEGSGPGAGKSAQVGVMLDTAHSSLIQGVRFNKISGTGLLLAGRISGVFNNHAGNIIANIFADSCKTGIGLKNYTNGAEYNVLYGLQLRGNDTAIVCNSGNVHISGSVVCENKVGIAMLNGANDSHNSLSGVISNHNVYNLIMKNQDLIDAITGCHFWIGAIVLESCTNLTFANCQLVTGVVNLTSNVNLNWIGTAASYAPTSTTLNSGEGMRFPVANAIQNGGNDFGAVNMVIGNNNTDGGLFIKSDGANAIYINKTTLNAEFSAPGAFGDNGDKIQVRGNSAISLIHASGTARILCGIGSPEGVVTAGKGSIYLCLDCTSGEILNIKETGSGNTGWVGK